jgi:dolichol-phosphate mannosyltransferase
MPNDQTIDVERAAPDRPPPAVPSWLELSARVRRGVRQPHNWFQLVQFGVVGVTGYAVNLLVFALCVHAATIDYHLSAVIAWAVSVLNNFWLNRHWTFGTEETHAFSQSIRFFVVSAVVFGLTYLILVALVSGADLPKVTAQALAIAAGTPLNFLGQKLWTFAPNKAA